MALKLNIISEQSSPLGARGSIVLGVGGGSIGRAQDNDWVLPDPQRFLSAHHARIRFRDGNYYIEDISTNGVYVNDSATPLGRQRPQALHDGDQLRFGEYLISVAIDTAEVAEASAIFPVNQVRPPPSPTAVGDDIGAELSLQDLFATERSTGNGMRPVDAFGQPVPTADTGILAFDSGQRQPPARLRIPASARHELRSAARVMSAETAGVEAFCRGAGIDARRLPAEASARLLHLAGLLLREALGGLKGLALTQHEIRSDNRIGIASEDIERVALQGLPVEDLLVRLLQGHDKRELDAVQWLRDTLSAARRHDTASVRALRGALTEFIALLTPADPAHAAGAMERFRNITDMADGKLPHLFAEAFARAFSAEFKRPNGGS